MKVLYVASEAFPFIHMGESGDVATALPKYLNRTGEVEARVILPNFSQIDHLFRENFKNIGKGKLKLGWREIEFSVEHLKYLEVDYYFISNEHYFNRENAYGESDDPERFAFFSKAVLESLKIIKFYPDIIHCNNISSAPIPLLLHERKEMEISKGKEHLGKIARIKTLFTLHSLKHQGSVNREMLQDLLDSDLNFESDLNFDLDSKIKLDSFLTGAITYADAVNCVSNSYLEEILTETGGGEHSELFRFHRKKMCGIRNGIDTDIFDPKKDGEIEFNYGYTALEKRRENKFQLQKELGLMEGREIPLVAIIGKLVEERGMELIKERIDDILSERVELIFLGSGEERYEDFFDYYSHLYPDKVFTGEHGEEFLTKKILSGADIILTPSQTEPCGLIQMLALRYGAIPVARLTGGIKETLNEENSFLFNDYSSSDMIVAIKEALNCYHNNHGQWLKMIEKGMRARNTWITPAKKYLELYKKLIKL